MGCRCVGRINGGLVGHTSRGKPRWVRQLCGKDIGYSLSSLLREVLVILEFNLGQHWRIISVADDADLTLLFVKRCSDMSD